MKEFVIGIAGIAVLFFLIFWGAYELGKKSCLNSYENYEPQYSLWAGCRVMWNGKLTPTDIVREIS